MPQQTQAGSGSTSSTGSQRTSNIDPRYTPLKDLLKITGVERVRRTAIGQQVVPHISRDEKFRQQRGIKS